MVVSDTLLVALVAATPPTLAAILTFAAQRRKLREIHALVNSRLDVALREIAILKEALTAKAVHEADMLRAAEKREGGH